ncbi:hypothetical protein Syun_011091 [Stephania yunnanensis]|uniref:Uncharacterized protein n=1 Tax=Stephania yunnanensis TaxID=152371 RepID=A0AAP0JX52_9MAGN
MSKTVASRRTSYAPQALIGIAAQFAIDAPTFVDEENLRLKNKVQTLRSNPSLNNNF